MKTKNFNNFYHYSQAGRQHSLGGLRQSPAGLQWRPCHHHRGQEELPLRPLLLLLRHLGLRLPLHSRQARHFQEQEPGPLPAPPPALLHPPRSPHNRHQPHSGLPPPLDVLVGSIIGFCTAWVVYRQHYPALSSPHSHLPLTAVPREQAQDTSPV